MGNQQNLPHHGNLKTSPATFSGNQFTEKRLLYLYSNEDPSFMAYRYDEIEQTEWPAGGKMQTEFLPLRMKDGRVELLHISGKTSDGNDLFVVMTLLDNLISSLKIHPIRSL